MRLREGVSLVAATSLALAVSAVARPAGGTAAAERPLLTTSTPAPTLDFDRNGRARVTLVVRNDARSDAVIAAHFIGGSGDTPATTARPDGKLPLEIQVLAPRTGVIPARDAVLVSLLFARRPTASASKKPLTGTLVLRLVSGTPPHAVAGPLIVPLAPRPAVPEQPAPEKLRFAQKGATISLTRVAGPIATLGWGRGLLWGERLDIATHGVSPRRASTLLNGASGGSAKVTLRRTDAGSSALSATNVTRAGTYQGSLTLDPQAKKPRTLDVTVKARDLVVWPLLAVLAGVGLSALGLRRWAVRRNGPLVQAALVSAVEPYRVALDAHREAPSKRPDHFNLSHRVPQASTYDDYFPQKCHCERAEGLADVPRLFCGAYSFDTSPDAEALSEEATAVVAEFRRWLAIERAASLLWSRVRMRPESSPIRLDAELVLAGAALQPLSEAEADEIVDMLHAEIGLVAGYSQAHRRYCELPEEWRAKRKLADPGRALEALEQLQQRTAADVRALDLHFRRLVVALQEPGSIPEDPPADELRHASLLAEPLGRRARVVVEEAARGARRSSSERPTPQAIYSHVRRLDWLVFWATGTLTALTYVAATYDGDWGSSADYAVAFAAGAVTPAVVNWAIVPWALSYRIPRKTPPQPPAQPEGDDGAPAPAAAS